MGILFISHSSADNAAAIRVREWLKEQGWSQVFLDLDAEQGIVPGHRWQQELKLAGERCSGVIPLISPNWVASRWCQTEFLVADQLGKKIFPVLIAPTDFGEVSGDLTGRFQFADISIPTKAADGFARLAVGLKRAGLDPQSFIWPPPNEPNRLIYRGLQSLDQVDAAIFFGRDALITKGMDAMRRIRQGAPERMLVILGASGAGKSSFLKAGLVARMQRDEENFLVLPTIRPERAAISGAHGLAASFGCDPAQARDPHSALPIVAALRAAAVEDFQRYASAPAGNMQSRPPTVVIPLDQAEELFLPENREAGQAIEVLSHILQASADVVLVVTIRSDSFQKLQAEPRLAQTPLLPFSLPPIPLGAFKEVIEGPARLASPSLTIESALCDRLLEDLAAEDALPLLAFTLERLLARHPRGGGITLREYLEEFGELEGAIVAAVEAAFSEGMRDPALPRSHVELEKLARAAFIPALVHLDDTDSEPRRRVEPLETLPSVTRPLVRHLINQRLLVCHKNMINGVEIDTVEVTHEAILRQWPALRTWIAEERGALRALDAVRDAAAEWRIHSSAGGEGWLAHRGGRLQEADALLARPDFASALDSTALEYLAACHARDDAERLREKETIERTRRLQRRIGLVIIAAAVIVLIAGASVLRLFSGMTRQASESLSALAGKEAAALNYDRALRYAAVGLSGVGWGSSRYGGTAAAELQGAAAASSALAVLRGHTHQVLSAAFSPDGRRIVTGSRDKTARIWDAMTGQQIAILRGHTRAVFNAAFSPDGKRIVTASEDKTARIWSENAADPTVVLKGHQRVVYSAAFNPDGSRVVTASYDTTARVWDTSSGREILVLRGHSDAVESAAFSPDGTRIVTGSDDKTARIWDAQSGKQLTVLNGHTGVVEGVAFSYDGKRVVTASDDKTARIWDATDGQLLQVLRGHTGNVSSAAFSSNGAYIVTSSGDKTVRLWSATDGLELVRLVHDDAVNSANFSRDASRIVTASDDKTVRIWSTQNGLRVLRGHEGSVIAVVFSPDSKRVATASVDRTVRLWDIRTRRETATLRGHQGFVDAVAFSPDGTRCVSGSDDTTARIWDAKTGRQLAILRGHTDAVYSAAYSPDGRQIVTASIDGTARIWDAATEHTTAILHGDRHQQILAAGYSGDSSRVVTGFSDGTAAVWDSRTGNRLLAWRADQKHVNGVAFSHDGKWIVTAGWDRTARIWDAQSGRQIAVLSAHERPLAGAEFSRDARLLATASADQTIRVWNVATAQEIAVLRGHEGAVNGISFSPDGNRLASASDDGTVRIWNISGIVSEPSDALLHRVCATALSHGLSVFSPEELRAARPALDPAINADACHPPGVWSRLGSIFWAGFSN